ncbi:MAG: NADP-dependent isocitrate dehydrogenase [Verrucomicrobia bacterium]|nr:NADP-dependent isocitrate dehydrogenase [Verrucomicrobiota bacterium]
MAKTPITVARGDGIGPEIMEATLRTLQAAGAELEIEEIVIGKKIYESGHPTGIEEASWESIRRTAVFLKSPITAPQGGGVKSLNVTVRTALGLFANIRPCVSYFPYVSTKHPAMDVVVVRENEEDLYIGCEYKQTAQTQNALKLITRPGSERIIRYAFEYARAHSRKKVTCFTKDNILKITDGLFHAVFEEIAAEYPDIENEHWIVDIGSAKLADSPEVFDVIVLPNLYGDILSDVAAQIAGSVGLAGSANIGAHAAMFEAIHGSAPKRAGQNVANPSGLMHGAILMLDHIGQQAAAERMHNAWLKTIEDGIHTYDCFKEGVSRQKVGTHEFTDAICERMGQKPEKLKAVSYTKGKQMKVAAERPLPDLGKKELVGIDLFIDFDGSCAALQEKLAKIKSPLQLKIIFNRGVKIWPEGLAETLLSDQWRCRYMGHPHATHAQIAALLAEMSQAKIDFIQVENLYTFGGKAIYCNA